MIQTLILVFSTLFSRIEAHGPVSDIGNKK